MKDKNELDRSNPSNKLLSEERRHMKCKLLVNALFILSTAICFVAQARDLAGIPWQDFLARSDFIFAGTLMKAESLGMTKPIRYTFLVNTVFKGPHLKEVTIDVPFEELSAGITVNSMGMLALKRTKDLWELSVDERSWWPLRSEMKEDFGGLPVYSIPTILLYDVPEDLGEKRKVKRLYEDGYHLRELVVYPVENVNRQLVQLLTAKEDR